MRNFLRMLPSIVFGLAVLAGVIFLIILPLYQVEWSGFGAYGTPASIPYEREKTLWAWMQLLIVPFLLGIIAYVFNNRIRALTRRQDEERFREDTLQKYLDAMSGLLLREDSAVGELSAAAAVVARLRTVTVLRRLDRGRIQEVINFLRDTELLDGDNAILSRARLTDIALADVDLKFASLSGTNFSESQLVGADLSAADLQYADFTLADLSGANLNQAILVNADLSLAKLDGAYMEGARLTGANLDGTVFTPDTLLPDGTNWSPTTDMRRFTNPVLE